MAPDDKESLGASSISSVPRHIEDQNTASANASNQALLTALQDFIVPLIRAADRKRNSGVDQKSFGPEARRLLIALQEFVSSIIIRSQSDGQNIIEVDLDEDQTLSGNNAVRSEATNYDEESDPSLEVGSVPEASASELNDVGANVLEDESAMEKPEPTFHDKLLKDLRKHVFNTMPIRLLSFEPHGSSLKITLIEREAVYARIESVMQEKIHADVAEFRPIFTGRNLQTHPGMETDQEAIERLISKYARYAILSHTWLRAAGNEVTYSDWNKGKLNSDDPGHKKLVNFCKIAWKDHGLTFGWMDTICINKESSSELDESIRSMYNWYRRAAVCIIYLAETVMFSNMHTDPWFTRGWTLQELLAPRVIKFYNDCWKRLAQDSNNDKNNEEILQQIERATTMAWFELAMIQSASISRRMELAATRQVTREEDTAYSLMGIFNVSFSTAYGEGAEHAFSRLLQEILVSSRDVLDMFNCPGNYFDPLNSFHRSFILPLSPQQYLRRSRDPELWLPRPMEPLTFTHLGVRIPVILMQGVSIQSSASHHKYIGDYSATVNISPVGKDIPTSYNLLDDRIPGNSDGYISGNGHQVTFAVFNFSALNETAIRLWTPSIAVALWCSEVAGKVSTLGSNTPIRTAAPVVFRLRNHSYPIELADGRESWFDIHMDELATHGMQLVSLYL